MRRKHSILLTAGALCLLALTATLVEMRAAPASPAASYAIPWWSVDAGGGSSQGGVYQMSGAAGQPDAGILSGGVYQLRGGFWSGLLDYRAYLPMLRR